MSRRQHARGPSRNGNGSQWSWADLTPGAQFPQNVVRFTSDDVFFDAFGMFWQLQSIRGLPLIFSSGKAQFHLIPTASKKLVDAPFQSLVHILQQPSCNDETLLTSLALDVEFFVQLNFYSPTFHSRIPLKILWTNPIATVPEGG